MGRGVGFTTTTKANSEHLDSFEVMDDDMDGHKIELDFNDPAGALEIDGSTEFVSFGGGGQVCIAEARNFLHLREGGRGLGLGKGTTDHLDELETAIHHPFKHHATRL